MNLRQKISALLILATVLISCSCGSSSSGSSSSHLIYVSTGQGIYGYRIDKSGFSTALPSAPFIVGNTPSGMVFDASGKRGYVANQGDNTISLLNIDSNSGVVSEVLPRVATNGFSPGQLLLDSASSTLFATNLLSNSVSTFSIGSNGALTLQGTTPLLDSPANVAFGGGLLFVALPNIARVYVFSVNSGALNPVNGSPLVVSNGVGTVTVDPSAKYLYVTNPANNTISGYSIQYTSGSNTIAFTLIPGSPFAPSTTTTTTTPVASILDSTATHLYVANSGSGSVSLFSVGTNGSLTSMTPATVTTAAGSRILAFDAVNHDLLVGNVGSKTVTELTVKADATLSTTGQSVNVPSVPQAIATAP